MSISSQKTGPLHAESRAETSSAAAAYLQTAASYATSGAGHQLVSVDPAAGGIQHFTTILITPVARRGDSKAPRGGRPYCYETCYSLAQQSFFQSFYLRQQSPHAPSQQPVDNNFSAMPNTPKAQKLPRKFLSGPSPASGSSSGGPSRALSPGLLEQRFDAMN